MTEPVPSAIVELNYSLGNERGKTSALGEEGSALLATIKDSAGILIDHAGGTGVSLGSAAL